MNIYKKIKVIAITLSLISLTSCNFMENLAMENPVEQTSLNTIENTSDTETSTTDIADTDIQSNTNTEVVTTAPNNEISINYNEITTPSYDTNYVTTTQPNYPIDTYTYSNNDVSTTATTKLNSDTSYLEKYCAFIGDSLTVGLSAYGFIPEEHTFAKEGITLKSINSLQLPTDNGYLSPAQAVASWKPKEVFILLGINGVSWIDNNEAISEYVTLINNIRQYNPSIQINIISVLPVSYSTETIDTVANGRILNSEIDTFNNMLQSMANQLGCHYVNANASMKNQNGYLSDEITFDGLHLTMSGYEKLIDILVQDVQLRN